MNAKRTASPAKKRRPRQKTRKPDIRVQLDRHPTVLQPNETFRVCPLGLQFYSPKKVADFQVMDFRMQMAQGNGTQEEVACSGVVVHCQKEKPTGLYRVWVKFLDLAQDNGARLECAAKHADAICPHCENY
ncbi:MAG: hypothetical protein EPN23_04375 [Verrucomicrobia bacterium]|nr:MAG: hypothetical protein EPN23_04375 [Verrucomicrobiota bacterium]